MREIKFRAYDESNARWCTNETMINSIGEPMFWGDQDHGREIIIQMFTGLKDKNGKEIYEGDILAGKIHKRHFYCEVIWIEHGFRGITHPGKQHCDPLKLMVEGEGYEYNEVVGNIYETPDLLK